MLIRGGRLVDPAAGIDALRDLRSEGAVVTEIGEHLRARPDESIIEARGCIVAPGFIDMHVHLREPGNPEKETIATGTLAAVRGGFTAVACMPNTNPALDTPATLAQLERIVARDARARVYPIAAITLARAGEEPVEFAALARAGAVAFSDDGHTVMNARVLLDAALQAASVPGVFISHAEDEHLKGNAVMNLGEVSRALGVAGAPGITEEVIVARDLLLGIESRKAWHIAHLSTARGLDFVRWARARGAAATCEATPHHLLLSDESVRELGAAALVNPPLRSALETRALREGVRDGTIDVLASDHAPHTQTEKSGDLRTAAVGFSGLEIAVGAYALALPDLPMQRFVALVSTNPAGILGVEGGTLSVGARADVTIFADRPWTVDSTQFASKGKSTPFDGRTLPRRIVATIVAGELRYQDAESCVR
ncbi:MAG TPA: dihydroorotase [Candidatus Baltobacteraceae bacterium]|nr:dihydroorotase [Candidatus Baltobacteraceae bacterium]